MWAPYVRAISRLLSNHKNHHSYIKYMHIYIYIYICIYIYMHIYNRKVVYARRLDETVKLFRKTLATFSQLMDARRRIAPHTLVARSPKLRNCFERFLEHVWTPGTLFHNSFENSCGSNTDCKGRHYIIFYIYIYSYVLTKISCTNSKKNMYIYSFIYIYIYFIYIFHI